MNFCQKIEDKGNYWLGRVYKFGNRIPLFEIYALKNSPSAEVKARDIRKILDQYVKAQLHNFEMQAKKQAKLQAKLNAR